MTQAGFFSRGFCDRLNAIGGERSAADLILWLVEHRGFIHVVDDPELGVIAIAIAAGQYRATVGLSRERLEQARFPEHHVDPVLEAIERLQDKLDEAAQAGGTDAITQDV